MDIDSAIRFGLDKLKYDNIKQDQKTIVESYIKGKDSFFCSQTGSGKSLTFEIAPFVFQYLNGCHKNTADQLKPIVLVISPLSSLMKSQVQKLKEKDINAVYLKSSEIESSTDKITIKDIISEDTDILFASPEAVLEFNRPLIMELSSKSNVKTIFIDEAHCIKKFGRSVSSKKQAYRPSYANLGELRSLFGANIPVVALTATASTETKSIILKDLCMTNFTDITRSPDKPNITYWLKDFKGGEIADHFTWLEKLIRTHGVHTPRMIVFFRQIKHISEIYEYLISSLGEKAYSEYNENGPNDDRNRLFDMFHLKTDDEVKESICSSYQNPCGNTRIVLASTSFSMGLDVKGVDFVIHYGPANDIDDYVQETGRAGRDLTTPCHAILMKHKNCLKSKNLSTEMKDYVKTSSCRRQTIMNFFKTTIGQVKYSCCDICHSNQDDTDFEIPEIISEMGVQNTSDSSDNSSVTLSVSDSDIEIGYRRPRIIYSSDSE